MVNMSYVKYENTFHALEECYAALNEGDDDISSSEEKYRELLENLCLDFVEANTERKKIKDSKLKTIDEKITENYQNGYNQGYQDGLVDGKNE